MASSDVFLIMLEDLHPRLVAIGDPRLAEPVAQVNDVTAIQDEINDMIALLRELRGAGLAAPQIGWSASVVVIEVRKNELFPNRPESRLFVLANPKILEMSEDGQTDWEGCFSVPGIVGKVTRASTVRVSYIDENGNHHDETFEGYLARVVQHELDHLQGRVFLQRLDPESAVSTVENFRGAGH